jgi:hypothetical protein
MFFNSNGEVEADDFDEFDWEESLSGDDYIDEHKMAKNLGLVSEEYQKALDDSDKEIAALISERELYEAGENIMRLVEELWTEDGTKRQQQIVKSLVSSELVTRLLPEPNDIFPFNQSLQPFSAISYFDPVNTVLYVAGWQMGNLKNGKQVGLVKWLLDQGITDGKCIFKHVISVTYSETGMCMYLFTYDKAIAVKNAEENDPDGMEEEIPF